MAKKRAWDVEVVHTFIVRVFTETSEEAEELAKTKVIEEPSAYLVSEETEAEEAVLRAAIADPDATAAAFVERTTAPYRESARLAEAERACLIAERDEAVNEARRWSDTEDDRLSAAREQGRLAGVTAERDRCVRIAAGCADYGGGYRRDPALFEAYQSGIATVGAALRAPHDTQTAALEAIGAAADPAQPAPIAAGGESWSEAEAKALAESVRDAVKSAAEISEHDGWHRTAPVIEYAAIDLDALMRSVRERRVR